MKKIWAFFKSILVVLVSLCCQDVKMSTNIDFSLSTGNERCNELYQRKASTTITVCACILMEYGPVNTKHILITDSHAIDISVILKFYKSV